MVCALLLAHHILWSVDNRFSTTRKGVTVKFIGNNGELVTVTQLVGKLITVEFDGS
jgi:hypothetical protein